LDVIRVIATGRNLFSAIQVLKDDFPIDYLVFSSGSGVMDWQSKEILYKSILSEKDTKAIADYMRQEKLNFIIQRPIPDNGKVVHFEKEEKDLDFLKRLSVYDGFIELQNYLDFKGIEANQFIAFTSIESGGINIYHKMRYNLPSYKIIRSTSPMNCNDIWLEVFPMGISKASGINFLASKLNIDKENIAAVGNDYNDLDMLNEFTNSYIVANAPAELKQKFQIVCDCADDGFTEAVNCWLSKSLPMN
jgi:HAD superfamily hydrolase (TIGR01484 family)